MKSFSNIFKTKKTYYFNNFQYKIKHFFSTGSQNEMYIWLSNVSPGKRVDDYKNKLEVSNNPRKLGYFEDKNPQYIFMGPRHSGVVTERGDLYTFGGGNWGILGHGDENSIRFNSPKLVEYFSKNNIKIKKVVMGDYHTLALTEDGYLYSWGWGGKKGMMSFIFSGNK